MWEYFTDQMREYFTTLFSDLGAGEQIHIRCLDKSGTAVAHDFFSTIDRAILFCLKHSGKNHVYPAVNPRDKGKVKEEKASGRSRGGGKNTVSRVVTLWADYDLEKFGKSKEEGLEYLQNLSCPPTMVLFTGAGLQPYWILEEPARSAEDMARSERIINAFTLWWGIDKGVKDYSRVLRAPGTENIKYDPPRMCLIEQPDNGARYSLDELEGMIPEEYKTPQKSSSPDPNGSHTYMSTRPLTPPEVPMSEETGGRNNNLTSYAGLLEGKDFSLKDIRTMLLERNYNPAWIADPLPEVEIDNTIMKSVSRWRQERLENSKNGHTPPVQEEDHNGIPLVFNYENYRKVREQGGFPPREVVGHALINGLSTNIFGEAGLGKSWFLLHFAHLFLQRGERVILLDFENGHQTLFERMEDFMVPGKLLDNFYPLRPEGDWGKAWAEFVSEVRPGLVGTDGLIGLLDSLGLSENDSQDIEKVKGQIFRPALDVGSTFLTLDHPGNEDKYRERGSSRKGQLFDARWKITNPGPRINRLAPVECKLILEKDRTSSLPIKVKDALTYRVGGAPFVVDLMTVISPGGLHQTERKVYEHIRGKGERGDRFSWIVEDLELSESTVDRWIKTLEERDLIRKADDGTWHVTPERVDRVSIPDATTSSYEAKLDSPSRFRVLFAYREIRESTISEVHEYLNPPNMPENDISRDEVRDITQALLDMGELRESGERGGHTLYAPTSTLEDLKEDEEPIDW